MKRILVLTFILTFSCATNQNVSDEYFLESLLLSNLKETPYTAHIKITKTEKNEEIYSDSGQVGYIRFKVYADVIETFKGDMYDRIEYIVLHEAPSQGPPIGEEFIVSLHYSQEKAQYYIPDNGYSLPVTETLKKIARSESK